MGWEEARSRIRERDLMEWFGSKGNFCTAAASGAGEGSIRRFLGGAFKDGHAVRDALVILNRPSVDPRIAGRSSGRWRARELASMNWEGGPPHVGRATCRTALLRSARRGGLADWRDRIGFVVRPQGVSEMGREEASSRIGEDTLVQWSGDRRAAS